MIKLCLLSLLMLFSCAEKSHVNEIAERAEISLAGLDSNLIVDTLRIDLNRSSLKWKGTKLMGLGKHEGDIRIQSGFLLMEEGNLSGGRFTINMKSLRVTDIPASDPIPLRNLTEHLKGEDFFAVDRFPQATFEILKVKKLEGNGYLISGNLKIKGISKLIEFTAESKKSQFLANFKLDRFDWNIAYEGSWADRTLVDREIEFWVELVGK